MLLDVIFNDFANNYALSCTHSQRQFLIKNKNIIINQALENIGLAGQKSLSDKEAELFKNELSQIVYFNGQLPSFLGKDELEDPRAAQSEEEKYAINARNLLKHLARGVPISSNDGENYSKSFLATNEII
ncbi:MAG TPA: hypothetical protein VHA13_00090, partial [Gammaproteobacteria bacterium]|nr:hypothetical protein [Gammaproteobacteria bacterium]